MHIFNDLSDFLMPKIEIDAAKLMQFAYRLDSNQDLWWISNEFEFSLILCYDSWDEELIPLEK